MVWKKNQRNIFFGTYELKKDVHIEVSINKVLLEHSRACSFICGLWLTLCLNGRGERSPWRPPVARLLYFALDYKSQWRSYNTTAFQGRCMSHHGNSFHFYHCSYPSYENKKSGLQCYALSQSWVSIRYFFIEVNAVLVPSSGCNKLSY